MFSKDISKYIIVKKGEFAYNPARINIGSIGINDFDFDGCVVLYMWLSMFKIYTKIF